MRLQGGVFCDDQVGGVDGLALGGERVLHGGEPQARVLDFLLVEPDLVAARALEPSPCADAHRKRHAAGARSARSSR